MADVDKPNQFPNSMMANAVKRGQSRFISLDDPATTLFATEIVQPPPELPPEEPIPNG